MPTGYTAPVQSGEIVELEDFILLCARAFGACVMQRDEPMKSLPKIEEWQKKTFDQWCKEKMDYICKTIEYHKDEHKKEVERVTMRNKWKIDLYTNLGLNHP
jgi:hypothetical protein